jgi:hypothetical protein
MNAIALFISYSHDSNEHRERVLGLSERLRADGIPTILDRYVEKGSPSEGWPRWMMNGLNAATHVLCVCTEIYRRRFLGQEVPDKGKGVDWAGALMTQALYDVRSRTNKFIPVLFARSDESHIPEPLRPQTHYLLDSEAGYQALYDALLDQSGVETGIRWTTEAETARYRPAAELRRQSECLTVRPVIRATDGPEHLAREAWVPVGRRCNMRGPGHEIPP